VPPPLYSLVLGILAVWRITHLLQDEDGPWNVLVRLRRALGRSFWGSLLDCFYCLSLWIAVPLALWLGTSVAQQILLWPALSGAAILLERLTARPTTPYWKEEAPDVLLRKESSEP